MSTEATPAVPVTAVSIAPAPAATPTHEVKVVSTAAAPVAPKVPEKAPEVAPEAKPAETPAEPAPSEFFNDDELTALEQDYASTKDFSEESIKILEKRGIRPELAKDWAAGREAQVELVKAKCALAVGGQKQLDEWRDWSSKNMTPADAETLNNEISAAAAYGPDAVATVVSHAYVKYIDEVGQKGVLVGGGQPTGVKPFRTEAEYLAAFADPRYRKSEEYRLEVDGRLRASTIQ